MFIMILQMSARINVADFILGDEPLSSQSFHHLPNSHRPAYKPQGIRRS